MAKEPISPLSHPHLARMQNSAKAAGIPAKSVAKLGESKMARAQPPIRGFSSPQSGPRSNF